MLAKRLEKIVPYGGQGERYRGKRQKVRDLTQHDELDGGEAVTADSDALRAGLVCSGKTHNLAGVLERPL